MIHAEDDARIREFAMRIPAMRVLVNTPFAAGLHRHHHQFVSIHDAGLRRRGRQRHFG